MTAKAPPVAATPSAEPVPAAVPEMATRVEEADGTAFPRAYDFFKHMTGITLVSLGGVFALMDGTGVRLDAKSVFIVVGPILLAGVTCLLMTNALVTLEVKPEPSAGMARKIRVGLVAATFFLAVGLGAYVPSLVSAITK